MAVLASAAPANAFELNGNPLWPGDPAVIEYSASVKGPGDKWAVETAIDAWNEAGPAVQFKRGKKKGAALRIRYTDAPCSRGYATLSFPPLAGELNIGPCKGLGRYMQVQLVTHELGHAIGLDHENGACATMNDHTEFRGTQLSTHPFNCPAPPRGLWRCRLLQEDDLRGAVKLYGGSIEPLGPLNCKVGKNGKNGRR